jgi:hypothetical protein
MMQFFLYEIVARVIAIYLLVDTGRALWYGLAERKTAVANYMFMDAFIRLPDWSADRDSAPVSILVSNHRPGVRVVRLPRHCDIWLVRAEDVISENKMGVRPGPWMIEGKAAVRAASTRCSLLTQSGHRPATSGGLA